MRRTPIRMKLAAALAVPLLGLLLVTVVEVVDTGREADEVRRQTELARASIGPSGLLTSLQNERTWAVIELIGQEGQIQPPVVGYEDSRAATDQALASFRETLTRQGEEAAGAYRQPLANLSELNEYIVQHLRESIVVLDADNRIRLINGSAAQLLGAPETGTGDQPGHK